MIDTVIFDMDGVLVDSEDAIRRAAMDALAEWGIVAEYGDFIKYTGMGDDLFVGGVAREHGGEYVPEMKARTYEIYCERAKDSVFVYPWSRKIIDDCDRLSLRRAVASAADLIKVKANLRAIGTDPDGGFGAIVTGSDVERKKPFPDIFLTAAARLRSAPEHCLVIEDALSGVRAAKAAGMTAVAVTTAFREDELYAAGADLAVDFPDLSSILASLANR